MQPTDKSAFAGAMLATWRFYGKQPSAEDLAAWFDLFAGYPLAGVAAALKAHLIDPERGQYLPKPADIIRHLRAVQPDDGRPSGDEAWGLLLRLVNDERETGVLSAEMREAWTVCDPILQRGDEVGARRCFLDAYARAVGSAREQGRPAHWTISLGTDPQLRAQRLTEAVRARRITQAHAVGLLNGPAPQALEGVAHLLEGPTAPAADCAAAQRLRELAALLRNSMAETDARKREELRQARYAWLQSIQPDAAEDDARDAA